MKPGMFFRLVGALYASSRTWEKNGVEQRSLRFDYMGGNVSLTIPDDTARQYDDLLGKQVNVDGELSVDVQQFGRNVETRVSYGLVSVVAYDAAVKRSA